MNTKILVTGAGGYIGSISTQLLLNKKYDVVAIDNFVTGYREPLKLLQSKFGKKRLTIYDKDLREDLTHIFRKEKNIKAVLHYAASCVPNESMSNPQKFFTNNVCGTQNLLQTLIKFKINNFIFSSTCAVYGESQYVPVDEKHRTNPENPYGESKYLVERIIRWYGELLGLKYVILRYFNVCGASDDGLIGDSKKPSELLVQNAVRGALGIEPFNLTCPEVNTPDKTPIRDFINVVDLNEAHLLALAYLIKGGKSEIINLGTGKGNSVLEIVNKVKEVTGHEFKINRNKLRRGEYEKMIASIAKARRILKWKPRRTIKDSIIALTKWYSKHPDGWLS